MLPTMETAVTLLMDGQPLIGERVVVSGQGMVGLATTALLATMPLAALVTLDLHPRGATVPLALGAGASLDPRADGTRRATRRAARGQLHDPGADLVFEVSGDPAGLDAAIEVSGFGGRVIVGSWYGREPAALHLGGRFHRGRTRLISSQVSTLAPEHTGRWTKRRQARHRVPAARPAARGASRHPSVPRSPAPPRPMRCSTSTPSWPCRCSSSTPDGAGMRAPPDTTAAPERDIFPRRVPGNERPCSP